MSFFGTSIYDFIRFHYVLMISFYKFENYVPLPDLARLPALLCLGSVELVLPCSLPCFALPEPPINLIRESPLWRRPKAASLMRLVGGRGKAKQGRLQGKTNSAEARQSKPGSRAKSAIFLYSHRFVDKMMDLKDFAELRQGGRAK